MRLIDADKLKIGISEKTRTSSEASRLIDIINQQPTAYDVDAVCEEIKKREKKFREYGEKYNDGEGISAAEACAGDIEIVRNGGINGK